MAPAMSRADCQAIRKRSPSQAIDGRVSLTLPAKLPRLSGLKKRSRRRPAVSIRTAFTWPAILATLSSHATTYVPPPNPIAGPETSFVELPLNVERSNCIFRFHEPTEPPVKKGGGGANWRVVTAIGAPRVTASSTSQSLIGARVVPPKRSTVTTFPCTRTVRASALPPTMRASPASRIGPRLIAGDGSKDAERRRSTTFAARGCMIRSRSSQTMA